MKGRKSKFLYLLYYFRELDWVKFRKFMNHVLLTTGKSPWQIWLDILQSVFAYNIGIIDYFLFRFYEKNASERKEWAGTGFMYEYHLKMNPLHSRKVLADKIQFYQTYHSFVQHANCTMHDLEANNLSAQKVLQNSSGKIVVKDALGQCGWDVEVLDASKYDRLTLMKYMKSRGFNLAEQFIEQHQDLNRLSASGLNTLRVITQIDHDGQVVYLGARLRITVNSQVDNMASGNIAAPVDILSGKVNGEAVYSDITKQTLKHHPISGEPIVGFQIPFWQEVLELTKQAALLRTENRSVGWDVAITQNGPELIEGNHNWCKLLWQLPVNTG
jgi:hypothetical protein